MQNTKPAPHEQILSIVLGFWQTRAVAVATEPGLPQLLAEGPLDVDQLDQLRYVAGADAKAAYAHRLQLGAEADRKATTELFFGKQGAKVTVSR